MNEEEINKAMFCLEGLENDKEHLVIEERQAISTIINLVKKQQKEIEFYKIQELGYLQGYEDGKSHKQTAVAIKNENAQYELIRRDRENLQKQIESYKERYENMKWYFDNQEDNLIHKNRIKEKIELLKDIKKANCYKQLTEDYIKGAIEQLEELLVSGQESDQEGGQEDE